MSNSYTDYLESTRRRQHTTGMCAVLITVAVSTLSPLSSVAAQGTERAARLAIAGEFFFPEDRDNRDIRVLALSFEAEKYLIGGLWLRGAVGPTLTEGVFVRDEDPQGVELEADAVGLGVVGFLRWRPVRIAGIAPFVEGAFGTLFTTEAFPPDGTAWNFTRRYGLGLDLRITEVSSVAVSYRHVHFSNGKGLVPENPSYDGDGVMLAISW